VPDVVQRTDVGVVETRNRFRLALEACAKRGIAGNMSRKYFDRNRPAQARVGRLIDLAHSTGADTRDDFVRAEPGWNQRHLWGEL